VTRSNKQYVFIAAALASHPFAPFSKKLPTWESDCARPSCTRTEEGGSLQTGAGCDGPAEFESYNPLPLQPATQSISQPSKNFSTRSEKPSLLHLRSRAHGGKRRADAATNRRAPKAYQTGLVSRYPAD
jgi:hypothetical protein